MAKPTNDPRPPRSREARLTLAAVGLVLLAYIATVGWSLINR